MTADRPTTPERDRLAALLHEAVGRTHSWPYPTRQVCHGARGHLVEADRLLAAGVRLDPPAVDVERLAWAEQVIQRWRPDEVSRATERKARQLAGPSHRHGAIPARFWREAIAREYAALAKPENERA